jgi:hypothetical protein
VVLILEGDNMKKTIITIILAVGLLAAMAIPSIALSSLANNFIKACTALDSPFPPRGWDRGDLRDAALEVLNNIERGDYPKWPTDFCLKALGYTQYPEDLDRILAYEKTMNSTVLRSLQGFPSPRAVDLLIKYLGDKEATTRELAAWSLADIDFKKFDKPTDWRNKVVNAITTASKKEKESWLKKDYRMVLDKISSNAKAKSS